MLLGMHPTESHTYIYGAITRSGTAFQRTSTSRNDFLLRAPPADKAKNTPTTPHMQPLPGITHMRFSLIRFRSPLLSESLLFSLPVGTEMFHFPTFPPHTLFHSGAGNWTQLQLGYPIRKPPDQRSVANSPGHIAGSHVLHRLSIPRHPPCALTNLPNKPPTHTTHTSRTKPTRAAHAPAAVRPQSANATNYKPTNDQTKRHTTCTTPTKHARRDGYSRPLSRYQTTRSQQTEGPQSRGPRT